MPTISANPDIQTVITTYDVTPATCEELVELLLEAYDSFLRHQPGFKGAAVHVNDARTRIASYSQWGRRDDFLAVLRSEEMRGRNRAFAQLSKSFEPVMYEVFGTYERPE